MSLAVTSAVIGKLAVVNRESAGWRWCAEQAILVIMEIAIVEGKIAAFIANSGSVAIGYLCTRELKVVDCDVAISDENRLAVRDQAGRYHRDHPAHPLQRDVLADRDIIVDVSASLHFDRVAVLRGGNCGSDGRIRLPRTDAQDSHSHPQTFSGEPSNGHLG